MELGNLIFGNSRGVYPVAREKWEDRFVEFLDNIECDSYGYLDVIHNVNERGGITTDKFIIRPYYWGESDVEAEKPNFEYLPTGYKLDWYKYPLRDAYANQDITYEEFDEMLKDCERFMVKKS